MILLNSAKLAVLGTVGLSAIGFLGVANPADAATVVAGSDYLSSPAGLSFYDFPGIGIVNFQGLPIGPGDTDTIIKRQDCVFSGSSCHTDIEMTDLSLVSTEAINIGGSFFDIFVSLTPQTTSNGKMWINDDGTFSSELNVLFDVSFAPQGSGIGSASCILQNCSFADILTASGQWGSQPPAGAVIVKGLVGNQDANLHTNLSLGDSDFFLAGIVDHDHKTFAGKHRVVVAKTPEPSTALATIFVGLGAMFGLRRNRKSQKD